MSFANYTENIGGQVQFAPDDIFLKQEPTSLDEGARVADTITYFGNATYPLSPPTVDTVGAGDTTFKTLFVSGLNEDDIMRIRPSEETQNFKQYSNVTFDFGLQHSCPSLDLRLAVLDASLNVIQTYDTVSVDLSGLSISKATLRGFSVDYPSNGVFATLQGSNPSGTGTASLTFNYFNSQLENAIDTSVEPGDTPSRSPTDLFAIETFDTQYDLSGTGAIISALQSDVATNQADIGTLNSEVAGLSGEVDTAVLDIASLQSGKVAKAGDTMTGTLTLANPSSYPTGWRSSLKIGAGLASCIEANDPSDDFCPAIGFYGSEANGQRNIYFWTGVDSGNQRNPPPDWVDYTAVLGDSFQIRTNLNMARGNALPGNIIMDSQNVKGMGEPVDPSDATTKNYVDTATAGFLPRVGGTMAGALNMGGYRINNLQTPATATDGATKAYVDQAIASGGGTVTGFDAPLTINNANTDGSGLLINGTSPSMRMVLPSPGAGFGIDLSAVGISGESAVTIGSTVARTVTTDPMTSITVGRYGDDARTDDIAWTQPITPNIWNITSVSGSSVPSDLVGATWLQKTGFYLGAPDAVSRQVVCRKQTQNGSVYFSSGYDSATEVADVVLVLNNSDQNGFANSLTGYAEYYIYVDNQAPVAQPPNNPPTNPITLRITSVGAPTSYPYTTSNQLFDTSDPAPKSAKSLIEKVVVAGDVAIFKIVILSAHITTYGRNMAFVTRVSP